MHRITILAAAAAVGLVACTDGPTAVDNATQQDRQEVISALDASGWFTDAFGVDGTAEDLNLAVSFNLSLTQVAVQDTVPLTQRWGRRYGAPVSREYTVTVVGDTAEATAMVTFDGVFVLDRTRDGVANPTQKPLQEQAVQRATLVRRGAADSSGRHWQLVALSPREWRMTDDATRTVHITRVVVAVNGETKLDVSDPTALFDIDHRIPRLHLGDSVSVLAEVDNTTGIDNVPPTFVFLHVYHYGPAARGWVRIPMRQRADGMFVRYWIVRFTGRERMVVDAIDSQAFNTDTENDYRANSWGIPYRIE
jgi:hypothetical protein